MPGWSGRFTALAIIVAAASAIAFVVTKLQPGQSTDGAVFWATAGKPLGAGRLTVNAAGEGSAGQASSDRTA